MAVESITHNFLLRSLPPPILPHHVGAGELVVPGLLADVPGCPDETESERERREECGKTAGRRGFELEG